MSFVLFIFYGLLWLLVVAGLVCLGCAAWVASQLLGLVVVGPTGPSWLICGWFVVLSAVAFGVVGAGRAAIRGL